MTQGKRVMEVRYSNFNQQYRIEKFINAVSLKVGPFALRVGDFLKTKELEAVIAENEFNNVIVHAPKQS